MGLALFCFSGAVSDASWCDFTNRKQECYKTRILFVKRRLDGRLDMKAASMLVLLAVVISNPAYSQVYACIEEGVNGYEFKNNALSPTIFMPRRFIFKIDGSILQSSEPSGRPEIYKCTVPSIGRSHILQCAEDMYFIVFDCQSARKRDPV